MPAYNWRFSATAAVAPRKKQRKFESSNPAEIVLEAATAGEAANSLCTSINKC